MRLDPRAGTSQCVVALAYHRAIVGMQLGLDRHHLVSKAHVVRDSIVCRIVDQVRENLVVRREERVAVGHREVAERRAVSCRVGTQRLIRGADGRERVIE